MLWYYAAGGEQRGPVSQDELQNLVSTGTIQDGTLVWKDGMASWEPLERVAQAAGIVWPSVAPIPQTPPLASPSAPQTPLPDGTVLCAECGRQFPVSDTVQYDKYHVCAQCKPRLIQRLSEGASLPPSSNGSLSEQELLSKDYDFDFSGVLSNSSNAMKREPLMLIAAPILSYVAIAILVSASLLLIQIMGPFAQIVEIVLATLLGPLMAGLLHICLSTTRNQPVEFSNIFYGFGPRFIQLTIVQGIPQLVHIAILLPGTLLGVTQNRTVLGAGNPTNIMSGLGLATNVWMSLGGLLVIYLSICWMYATFLVLDKNYNALEALKLSFKIVRKHWWLNFLVIILIALLSVIGGFACCIGVLVSIPFGTCMYTSFYRQIFDQLEPKANRI